MLFWVGIGSVGGTVFFQVGLCPNLETMSEHFLQGFQLDESKICTVNNT